jgi:hypothetical protein
LKDNDIKQPLSIRSARLARAGYLAFGRKSRPMTCSKSILAGKIGGHKL